MGTRSDIMRKNEDGSFDRIYCHWDGYPSNNGKILLEHYTDPKKIDELLKLGDLSSLAPNIGTKHDWSKPPEGECNAYGRDREEYGVEMKHYDTAEEVAGALEDSWTEWCYIFVVSEGKWYFTNNPSPTWFKCCGTEQMPLSLLTMEACTEDALTE